jgi:hypothetical protein
MDRPHTPDDLEKQRKRLLPAAQRKLERSRRLLESARARTTRPKGRRKPVPPDEKLPQAA